MVIIPILKSICVLFKFFYKLTITKKDIEYIIDTRYFLTNNKEFHIIWVGGFYLTIINSLVFNMFDISLGHLFWNLTFAFIVTADLLDVGEYYYYDDVLNYIKGDREVFASKQEYDEFLDVEEPSIIKREEFLNLFKKK